MVLKRAGNHLLTVYVDHCNLNRLPGLWELVDRIKEFHFCTTNFQLAPFLSSLGPAPNLRVLSLRPESLVGIGGLASINRLYTIFSGHLPLLRNLTLTNILDWPVGIFRGLASFECGAFGRSLISPTHVLDVLRESPSIKYLRLVGYCTLSQGPHPPAVTLPSLEECALIGRGTTSLIRLLTIPASARVFLSEPHTDVGGDILPKFNHLSVASGLRILGEVSKVSFSVNDHAVQLQASNAHGGVLDAEVDELYGLSRDPVTFSQFVRSSFECGRTCPGFKTTKVFALDVGRDVMWEPGEASCFALDIMGFIFNLPSIEEVKLLGVPSLEFSSILEFLSSAAKSELPCPNLRRIQIESIPLRSPRSLLVELSRLLAERKEAGVPLQSVTVKVKCEALIQAPEHLTFLTSWRELVREVVRVEYERTELKKLPRCRRRKRYDEEDWDSEDEDEEGESYYEEDEGDTSDPDDGSVGWDGWPKEWPETVE